MAFSTFKSWGGDSSNGQGPGGNDIPGWRFSGGKINSYHDGSAADPSDADYVVQDDVTDGDGLWTVSTVQPRTGTYHFRQVGDGHNYDNIVFGSEAVTPLSFTNAPTVGVPIVEGQEWTATAYGRLASTPSDTGVLLTMQIMTFSATSNITQWDTAASVLDTTYNPVTEIFTFASGTYNAAHTHFAVYVGWVQDNDFGDIDLYLDDIDLSTEMEEEPDTLFVRNAGFRFPYQRWQ